MVRTIGLGVLAALPACGVLPQVNEPVNLYTLTPKTTFTEALPEVDWQLVVETPVSAASLDTPRIALQRTPLTFEYYAEAAWTDNAPAMVQTLLIESFESTGQIPAVGREAIGLRPDFILKTDLREFEAIYKGDNPVPVVWVRMNAKLVRMPDRRIIASETFGTEMPATGGTLKHVVEAFDEALGKVLKQIVVFTLTAPKTTS
ncbi:MAG: ABC-type transport auxiliary lipoprotein family protein [Dongiaceae bacterium]